MPELESDQIQTALLSGMGKLRGSCLGLFSITDFPSAFRRLGELAESTLSFDWPRTDRTLVTQLAFTAEGLRVLELDAGPEHGFDHAFCEGMHSPFRKRTLGDLEVNDPDNWRWSDREVHLALWVYGITLEAAEEGFDKIISEEDGFSLVSRIATERLPNVREHFGFRDGLSNVKLPKPGQGDADAVGAGDFVFGHRDAFGNVPAGPAIDGVSIGSGGSYLVIRQLEQDVKAFWEQWLGLAGGDPALAVWLASKAVGRWPNGMPLDSDKPGRMPALREDRVRDLNFDGDDQGLKCPYGSHIRRSNPRDTELAEGFPKHRLIRRGRVYGPAAPESWFPEGLNLEPNSLGRSEEAERGILFACLNTDIARQFEFVQQSWVNNPKFKGLHNEVDPITGGRVKGMQPDVFTIPARPFRRRACPVKSHVTVRGGGYFFLPGKLALRRILRLLTG